MHWARRPFHPDLNHSVTSDILMTPATSSARSKHAPTGSDTALRVNPDRISGKMVSTTCSSKLPKTYLIAHSNFNSLFLCFHKLPSDRSRQPSPRIDRIRHLTSIRPILRIPLITIHIQPILARRRLHRLLCLNCLHPLLPSATFLWLWPASVRPKDALEPQYPRRHLDVDEGEGGAEEEGAGRVGCGDELGELVFEVGGFLDLGVGLLCLELGGCQWRVLVDAGRGSVGR